jgi:hypothetical protein
LEHRRDHVSRDDGPKDETNQATSPQAPWDEVLGWAKEPVDLGVGEEKAQEMEVL